MDKTERLNATQCFKFHMFLTSKLTDAIKSAFEFAYTQGYDSRETIKFIYSFLEVTGREKILENCLKIA